MYLFISVFRFQISPSWRRERREEREYSTLVSGGWTGEICRRLLLKIVVVVFIYSPFFLWLSTFISCCCSLVSCVDFCDGSVLDSRTEGYLDFFTMGCGCTIIKLKERKGKIKDEKRGQRPAEQVYESSRLEPLPSHPSEIPPHVRRVLGYTAAWWASSGDLKRNPSRRRPTVGGGPAIGEGRWPKVSFVTGRDRLPSRPTSIARRTDREKK